MSGKGGPTDFVEKPRKRNLLEKGLDFLDKRWYDPRIQKKDMRKYSLAILGLSALNMINVNDKLEYVIGVTAAVSLINIYTSLRCNYYKKNQIPPLDQ